MKHTKDRLAEELHKIGLHELADQAAAGCYHFTRWGKMIINFDLVEASVAGNKEATELRARCNDGEFNLTVEESDELMLKQKN